MLNEHSELMARAIRAAARRALRWTGHGRRWISLFCVILVTLPLVSGGLGTQSEQPRPAHPVALGFTFSQRQAAYLGLPWDEVFDAALDLSPSVIRLGAYWPRS